MSAAVPRDATGVAMTDVSQVVVDDGIRLAVRRVTPSSDSTSAAHVPFLLVHGLSSNARLWDGVARALADHGHPSVAVDLRSHGRSEGSDELGFERMVADLRAVIEHEGLERPVVVGQSFGGNVALELALTHPSLVTGVAGVDGGLIELSRAFPDPAACWAVLAPPDLGSLRHEQLAGFIRQRCAQWPEGAAEAQLANFAAPAAPGELVRPILTRARHRSIVEHLFSHRPIGRLSQLEVPMLLLHVTGDERRVVDGSLVTEARTNAAGRLAVVELPGRDHDVHLQEPRTVATLLLDWVTGRDVPVRVPEVDA